MSDKQPSKNNFHGQYDFSHFHFADGKWSYEKIVKGTRIPTILMKFSSWKGTINDDEIEKATKEALMKAGKTWRDVARDGDTFFSAGSQDFLDFLAVPFFNGIFGKQNIFSFEQFAGYFAGDAKIRLCHWMIHRLPKIEADMPGNVPPHVPSSTPSSTSSSLSKLTSTEFFDRKAIWEKLIGAKTKLPDMPTGVKLKKVSYSELVSSIESQVCRMDMAVDPADVAERPGILNFFFIKKFFI